MKSLNLEGRWMLATPKNIKKGSIVKMKRSPVACKVVFLMDYDNNVTKEPEKVVIRREGEVDTPVFIKDLLVLNY